MAGLDPALSDARLLESLGEAGLVDREQLARVAASVEETGRSATDLVLDQGLITEVELLRAFAARLQTRFVTAAKLAPVRVPPSVLERLPVRACEQLGCLPLAWQDDVLTAMFAVPVDPSHVETARMLSGAQKVVFYVSTWTAVRAAVRRHYYGDPTAFEAIGPNGASSAPVPVPRTGGDADDDPRDETGQTRVIHRSDTEMIANLRRENARLKIAQEFHRKVRLERDLDRQLAIVVDLLFDLFPADGAVLRLTSGHEARRSRSGPRPEGIPEALWERALDSPDGFAITATQARDAGAETAVTRGLRAALLVPLRTQDGVHGVLWLESLGAIEAFDDADVALVSALAAQAATVVHNAELRQRAEREASARAHLSRFLPPELVDQALAGSLDLPVDGRAAVVTVLYADIRGFTHLTARAGATEVVRLLARFYDEMTQAVFEAGGMVDKFMGDCAMAVWGAPLVRSDHAARALRAAFDMVRRVEGLTLNGQRVRVGVGVATGEVVLGAIGGEQRMDYTVIGSAVNVAARLCDLAAGGEIVAADETVRAAGADVQVEPLPPVPLDGVDPGQHYHLVRGLRNGDDPDVEVAGPSTIEVDLDAPEGAC